MSRPLGLVVSSRLASLHELGTVLGPRDLYTLVEIVQVNDFNEYQRQRQAGA